MKIAYLSASEIPSRAANSVHVMKMCAALASLGHEVVLFARRGVEGAGSPHASYDVPESFEIVYCGRPDIPGIGGAVYGMNVARALGSGRFGRFDLVYARHLYSLLAAASLGYPLAFEAHIAPLRLVPRWAERALLARANFVRLVVISAVLKADYLQMFAGLDPLKVVVAHDGADPSEVEGVVAAGPTGRLRVGYAGQLYAGKGMEIIGQLPALVPEADFHVLGGSPADVALWKSRVTAGNIHFHGHVPHAAVGAFIDGTDILLAPYQEKVSVYGSGHSIARWMSPLKLFEYMSRGRAIVCSDLPVLREVLTHERNALLVDADRVESWVEAIRRLSSDVSLRQRLGSQARKDFLDNFTWRARAARVVEGIRA